MGRADGRARVVVVTGASAGVGRAVVRAFARRGADVALLARGRDGLEGGRREVEAAGGRALILQADVADARQVEAAAEAVERDLGPIDVWVNNAMVSVFSPVKDLEYDEVRRVTEVTYLGCAYGTMAALRRMLPRDRGVVVQVGSALAYRSIPLQAAYCAAKHAIQGFSEGLRCELLHDGSRVRVTMVQLPALNTPHFGWSRNKMPRKPQPVPPIYQPEVAAEAIVWASEHDRRELTVGGMNSVLLLANRLFPGLGDHYLARTGYRSQQTDEPAERGRRDNLFGPVPGDHGAHGPFAERARPTSWQLRVNTNRRWLLAGGLTVALAVSALRRGRETASHAAPGEGWDRPVLGPGEGC